MSDQVKATYGDTPQAGYLFWEDEQVEAAWEPASKRTVFIRVTIKQRTLICTIDGQWYPVYMVEDSNGTTWIAGEGELRRDH